MIGQIIQSYLVSLGVQIDKPGFQQADATIKQTGATVERVTGSMGHSFAEMARNITQASTLITSALTGVATAALGLMKATASEDLAMQKYARSMMIGEDAAWRMKKATDALGESINDIALTPELLGRFTQLTADGSRMKVGGDFKQTMKDFRDLMFEFTRLKQEASYALNWVGYYLMKYLQKPLADIREKFRTFNDMVIKGMSSWTEKVARAIYYVIETGRHLLVFISDLAKNVKALWDSFPEGVKIAIASLAALWAVINASPLGRMVMLVSTLLLLIDDYYGYMEGKQAAFGKYWDILNEYIAKGKALWEEYKPVVIETLETVVEYLINAKDAAVDFAKRAYEAFQNFMNSPGMQWFLDTTKGIVDAMMRLGGSIIDTVRTQVGSFLDRLKENGAYEEFNGLTERLWRLFRWLYESVRSVVRSVSDFINGISKTKEVREFLDAIADLLATFLELFNAIWDVADVALKALFGGFDDTQHAKNFTDAIKAAVKILTLMIRYISETIRKLSALFKMMRDNTIFKKFWEGMGKSVKNVTNLILGAIKAVGKLGEALLSLLNKDFGKAKNLALSALKDFGKAFLGDDDDKKSGGRGGKGGKISDDPRVDVAERIAELTGADPALVYGNMVAESGYWHGEDTLSTLATEHHNYGGIKYYGDDPSKIAFAATDGGVFRHFDSDEEYARYAAETLSAYSIAVNARSERDYVIGLKNRDEDGADYTGGADLDHYASMVKSGADFYREQPDRQQEYYPREAYPPSNVPPHYLGAQPMESSLEGVWWYNDLKGWIGGVLKQEGAGNAEYTSGARTYEHQMRINPDAPNSYHVHGDAVDIVLPDGVDTDAIMARFEPYFEEVLYHSVEGGPHLHLGGYKGNVNYEQEEPATPAEIQEEVTHDSDYNQIGYMGGASIDAANPELKEKFYEATAAMRANGYDFYPQSASQNSIGFTSSGSDYWNIKAMLEHYGLAVTYDGNGGFYVSLPQGAIPTAFSPTGHAGSANPSYDYGVSDAVFRPDNNLVQSGILTPINQAPPTPMRETESSETITCLRQIIAILSSIQQGLHKTVGGILPEDAIGAIQDAAGGLYGHLGSLGDLAEQSGIFEQMQSGFNPESIANTISNSTRNFNFTIGDINLSGLRNPERASEVISSNLQKEIDIVTRNLMNFGHKDIVPSM